MQAIAALDQIFTDAERSNCAHGRRRASPRRIQTWGYLAWLKLWLGEQRCISAEHSC